MEKPGEVVTREELQARLWPADTFVDFEHSLNTAIKRLRDALGDSAENPRFVETLARRGYRFIAPVHGASVAASPPASALPLVAPPAALKDPLMWVASFVLLVAVGLSGWLLGRRSNSALAAHLAEIRVTANPAELPIHSAALSRDGNYVAYSDANGFFLHVLETGETRPVSVPQGMHLRALGWFPDGTHVLAFAGDPQTGRPSLWSLSVLGAEPRKMIDDAHAGSLSPDGQSIAFVRGDEGQQTLWLARSDGSDEHVLTAESANGRSDRSAGSADLRPRSQIPNIHFARRKEDSLWPGR